MHPQAEKRSPGFSEPGLSASAKPTCHKQIFKRTQINLAFIGKNRDNHF
jgi:hypothetical protein